MLTATTYHINWLQNNPINDNNYVAIDGIDGNLNINNNRWMFDMNFYITMDASLPMNLLSTTISLPFANISDLPINLSSSQNIPDWVMDHYYCQCYSASFNVDISDSNFFNQQLTNYLMLMNFTFNYDADVSNNTKFVGSQQAVNNFLNEWVQLQKNLSFNYSNVVDVLAQSGELNICNNYCLDSENGSFANDIVIYYAMNEQCDDLKKPIVDLMKIKSMQQINVLNTKVNFKYTIDGTSKINEYDFTNNESLVLQPNVDACIQFNKLTQYDEESQKIIDSDDGINGFYLPITSSGHYDIQFMIQSDQTYCTYIFHNNFNFLADSDISIIIKAIFIKNVDESFTKVVF